MRLPSRASRSAFAPPSRSPGAPICSASHCCCSTGCATGWTARSPASRGLTDLGGFLDIVLDFLIYAAVPFAFALADPAANALPAAFLIFSFMGTGSSFLAYAIMAAKRGIATELRGRKSLYYLGGLTEGTETIVAFVLACLWPAWFPLIAWTFGALCWLTTATRIVVAVQTLR